MFAVSFVIPFIYTMNRPLGSTRNSSISRQARQSVDVWPDVGVVSCQCFGGGVMYGMGWGKMLKMGREERVEGGKEEDSSL
jgi:hypothetical protein